MQRFQGIRSRLKNGRQFMINSWETYKREHREAHTPMPNPEGVETPKSIFEMLTAMTWKQRVNVLKGAYSDYIRTWKDPYSFSGEKRPEKDTEMDLKSLTELLKNSRDNAAAHREVLQEYVQARLNVLRDSMRSFGEGYRAGKQKEEIPDLLKSVLSTKDELSQKVSNFSAAMTDVKDRKVDVAASSTDEKKVRENDSKATDR